MVPKTLVKVLIEAYDFTLMSVHIGIYKKYCIITVHFYWTGKYKEVIESVLHCGHFMVSKSTSQQYQQHIGAIATKLAPH